MFHQASRKAQCKRSPHLYSDRPLSFERLENRALLAALVTVNSTGDADIRDSELTFREAILVNNRQLAFVALTAAEHAQAFGTPPYAETSLTICRLSGQSPPESTS